MSWEREEPWVDPGPDVIEMVDTKLLSNYELGRVDKTLSAGQMDPLAISVDTTRNATGSNAHRLGWANLYSDRYWIIHYQFIHGGTHVAKPVPSIGDFTEKYHAHYVLDASTSVDVGVYAGYKGEEEVILRLLTDEPIPRIIASALFVADATDVTVVPTYAGPVVDEVSTVTVGANEVLTHLLGTLDGGRVNVLRNSVDGVLPGAIRTNVHQNGAAVIDGSLSGASYPLLTNSVGGVPNFRSSMRLIPNGPFLAYEEEWRQHPTAGWWYTPYTTDTTYAEQVDADRWISFRITEDLDGFNYMFFELISTSGNTITILDRLRVGSMDWATLSRVQEYAQHGWTISYNWVYGHVFCRMSDDVFVGGGIISPPTVLAFVRVNGDSLELITTELFPGDSEAGFLAESRDNRALLVNGGWPEDPGLYPRIKMNAYVAQVKLDGSSVSYTNHHVLQIVVDYLGIPGLFLHTGYWGSLSGPFGARHVGGDRWVLCYGFNEPDFSARFHLFLFDFSTGTVLDHVRIWDEFQPESDPANRGVDGFWPIADIGRASNAMIERSDGQMMMIGFRGWTNGLVDPKYGNPALWPSGKVTEHRSAIVATKFRVVGDSIFLQETRGDLGEHEGWQTHWSTVKTMDYAYIWNLANCFTPHYTDSTVIVVGPYHRFAIDWELNELTGLKRLDGAWSFTPNATTRNRFGWEKAYAIGPEAQWPGGVQGRDVLVLSNEWWGGAGDLRYTLYRYGAEKIDGRFRSMLLAFE